jgi:nucleoside 2-deoxyribosyltransferase
MLTDQFSLYKCSFSKSGGDNAVVVSYRLKCSAINLDQSFSWFAVDSLETTLKNKVGKLMSILSNGGKLDAHKVYNKDQLVGFIEDNYIVLTPDFKLDSILEYLSNQTLYDGQAIELPTPHPIKIAQMYFYNANEWQFYLRSTVSRELISRKQITFTEVGKQPRIEYSLTVGGLNRLIEITEGKTSKYCFIAMAFQEDMFNIAENAIKPALNKCGFKHIMVSDEHIDSDKTINDAILAGIKKAKFIIADFTYHRGGVYFEAGYALGRGQKVIYTCREDEMAKAHFDIRNYQHIVWSDPVDYNKKLINKIEAFIKD